MLVVFGGLPGVGKTSIAQTVAQKCSATYLRIDAIEQAIRSANVLATAVGPAGYLVAYELAEANLRIGNVVIADSVNPLGITRQSWQSVALGIGCPILEVEIICSDQDEHRRRVEARLSDIADLKLPTWHDVMTRDYEPWPTVSLRIDSSITSASDAAAMIVAEIDKQACKMS